MNKPIIAGAAVLAVAAAAYWTLKPAPPEVAQAPVEGAALVSVAIPQTLSEQASLGKTAFDAVCAACHGTAAAGRMGLGPPLVHKIYEPSHHGDMAFFIAVQQGVRAHHWRFGNMPPQAGLTRAEVQGIVAYVRTLQRANGIDG